MTNTTFRFTRRWLPVLPAAYGGGTQAAPIEGELGSNAAALLVVLGLGALFMGLRNLRELRHKRLMPGRRSGPEQPGMDDLEDD